MYATLEDIKFQPQLIDPKAAKSIGRAKAAVLMQMIYWSKKSHNIIDGKKWFYNIIRAWNKQISYYSESTIKNAIRFLEKRGFIISRKMYAKKCDHTKWYSIVEEEVVSFFKEVHSCDNKSQENETSQSGRNYLIDKVISNPSIITKITTKITNSSSIENDKINNKDIDINKKEKKKNKNPFNSVMSLKNIILKSKNCSFYQSKKQEKENAVSKHQTVYEEVQSEGLSKIVLQEKDSISSSKKIVLQIKNFRVFMQ